MSLSYFSFTTASAQLIFGVSYKASSSACATANYVFYNGASGLAPNSEYEARLARELAAVTKGTAEKAAAEGRADALLKCLLAADQRAQYDREQAFEVLTCREGRTRRYRLRRGFAGNVYLLDESGREIEKFCIHTSQDIPVADNLIAQKLLLEGDEEAFLRIANRSIPNPAGGWHQVARQAA
jgi:hypothetical protein